jgi:hypothetical protein
MTLITADRARAVSVTVPSMPRLRLQPTGSGRTLLDGAWWPRSLDPGAELPGLVLAIEPLQGPVTRLLLHVHDWDRHPRRLAVAGRVLRIGYFASQPSGLLTAMCGRSGDRVDLLVIHPTTAASVVDAAMTVAATVGNQVHAQDIVHAVRRATPGESDRTGDSEGEDVWETEGGHLARSRRVGPGGHQ